MATKSSDGKLYYYYLDHLGSSHVITDAAAAMAERTEHQPFGGIASQTGPARLSYQFTGQRQDTCRA